MKKISAFLLCNFIGICVFGQMNIGLNLTELKASILDEGGINYAINKTNTLVNWTTPEKDIKEYDYLNSKGIVYSVSWVMLTRDKLLRIKRDMSNLFTQTKENEWRGPMGNRNFIIRLLYVKESQHFIFAINTL